MKRSLALIAIIGSLLTVPAYAQQAPITLFTAPAPPAGTTILKYNFNQIFPQALSTSFRNSAGQFDIFIFLAAVVDYLALFAGLLAFGFLIYGGFMYMTAGGETGRASKAVGVISGSIIGMIIVALSFVIVRFVLGLL